jgi:hypothetical protein
MLNGKWKETSGSEGVDDLQPHSIYAVNSLPLDLKRAIFISLIPDELVQRFQLDLSPDNPRLDEYLQLCCDEGSSCAELSLYHQPGFPDPVLYGQITDTANGPLHVLFAGMNDPDSLRYDIDRMPDGTPTQLGTAGRNLEAELAALQAGLAPGQVRRGLKLFGQAAEELERFVDSLGHEMYFVQPLFYHNAVIFERYGFAYAKGRRRMERIHAGFALGGEFFVQLDDSNPFRTRAAAGSIRLRSWALHDGLLDVPFADVTMYKLVGQHSEIDTCPGCAW